MCELCVCVYAVRIVTSKPFNYGSELRFFPISLTLRLSEARRECGGFDACH